MPKNTMLLCCGQAMLVCLEDSKDLSRRDQLTISRLCALLLLADAIEVSHTTRIRDVKMIGDNRCWHLHMNSEGNLMLEKWALAKHKTRLKKCSRHAWKL